MMFHAFKIRFECIFGEDFSRNRCHPGGIPYLENLSGSKLGLKVGQKNDNFEKMGKNGLVFTPEQWHYYLMN